MEWIFLALVMLIAAYAAAHMAINLIKGRDELDGLFSFKRRKKDP